MEGFMRHNKGTLIKALAASSGVSQDSTKAVITAFQNEILKTMKTADGKITLVGTFTLTKADKQATTGVNPQTKLPINIPAKKRVKTKFSDVFIKQIQR